MLILKALMISFVLGLAFATGCGDDEAEPSRGGGVGAACRADRECVDYSKPACLTELKPLEDLVDAEDPAGEPFRELTIPFPGGYCTNRIEDSCETDAACGDEGGCFRPFEGVDESVIEGLNGLGLPFDINEFAAVGLCLKPCTTAADCRAGEGYECLLPFKAFMDVINPEYQKTFCIQDVDVSYLLVTPSEGS